MTEKEKEKVNGIILVLSCMKHVNTRLKEFSLPKDDYCGWRVIYVVANRFMDDNFVIKDNFMIVKCEDSYIHLCKKLALSIKYVYSLFDIKYGVLRCADDLYFNERRLVEFLLSDDKPDFYGQSPSGKSLLYIDRKELCDTRDDPWMPNYYSTHTADFSNPQHNLAGVNIASYMRRPRITVGAEGVIYYLSNRASMVLVSHMEKINYNVFHFDEFSQSYPYTIEDCAVSFIMYFNNIPFVHDSGFFVNNGAEKDLQKNLKDHIGVSTNKYK